MRELVWVDRREVERCRRGDDNGGGDDELFAGR